MKRSVLHVITAGLLLSGTSLIQAQDQPSRLLRIFREDIKEGKGAAHEKTESAYVRAFSKSSYPSYLAFESMTGTEQVWFIERYDSYEAMEKVIHMADSEPLKSTLDALDAQDGEVRSGSRGMIATYQPDLSYTPVPMDLAKLRYVTINTIRIRPGRGADFAETRKLFNAAVTKAGQKSRRVVYAVNSGMPAGTYLILRGMESLKDLDPTPGAMSVADAYGPENLARYDKIYSDIVISAESTMF